MQKKKLIDQLVEERTEIDDEVKLTKITSVEHENVCKYYCTIYVIIVFNNFYNQHWNWYLFCLFLLMLKLILKFIATY